MFAGAGVPTISRRPGAGTGRRPRKNRGGQRACAGRPRHAGPSSRSMITRPAVCGRNQGTWTRSPRQIGVIMIKCSQLACATRRAGRAACEHSIMEDDRRGGLDLTDGLTRRWAQEQLGELFLAQPFEERADVGDLVRWRRLDLDGFAIGEDPAVRAPISREIALDAPHEVVVDPQRIRHLVERKFVRRKTTELARRDLARIDGQLASSSAPTLVFAGSSRMPGPMVVVRVAFLT